MLRVSFLVLLCSAALQGFQHFNSKTPYEQFLEHTERRATRRTISNSEINSIEQPLDHFDSNNPQRFQMRYATDDSFWKPNGPILVFIGGEADLQQDLSGFMIHQMAQTTGALLIATEHRYYGGSQPALDLRYARNYQYLNSRQALADIANLIQTLKKNPNAQNSKVVVVGGSYPGNLAAWMKLMYPDLIVGAVSSSGPVLAEKDFTQFLEKVGKDFSTYGTPTCYNQIAQIFQTYDELFQTQQGIDQLKRQLNICPESDLTKPVNKQLFYFNHISPFMVLAQHGQIQNITNYCHQLRYTRDAEINNPFISNYYCNTIEFNEFMLDMYLRPGNGRSWLFQTCTEFGYDFSTGSSRHPFTNNLPYTFYVSLCTAAFGPEFNEQLIDAGVAKTNAQYGGKTPSVTNVIFVNNDADPWSTLGVTERYSSNPVFVVPNSFHCQDLWAKTGYDSPEMAQVKDYVYRTVGGWLQ